MSKTGRADALWREINADPRGQRARLPEAEQLARRNRTPAEVVFGTSGWRGIVGGDYTFHNLKIVTAAIIEMCRTATPKLRAALGVKNFADVQRRGLVVGHDNRYLGPEFAATVEGLLAAAGIRVYHAGEAITPEFSAAVLELGAAGSINLTPSHNPAGWAGFKFNPADGGPAGAEITGAIEQRANEMMAAGATVADPPPATPEALAPTALYRAFLARRGTINLARVADFLEGGDVTLVVDHVHGASRGRPAALFGFCPKCRCLRTNDDPLFGGVAPEPSSKNMAAVTAELAQYRTRLKLGVILDPDGDRIRFTDGRTELPMNQFGALALHHLHVHRHLRGCLVKSVATSNFANAIAARLGIAVVETPVGFKNFRPYMLPDAKQPALVAFEESDGISGYRHTLEKDALFGLLLALDMMAATDLNLGDYLRKLQGEYGAYFPERGGIEVDRALAGRPLVTKLAGLARQFPVGGTVSVGGQPKTIRAVNTVDGTRVVFADDSWLLVRPSGTEPKVRFYVETRTAAEFPAMLATAKEITAAALRA